MGTFSDSPGAIYPALQRLETGGLLHVRVAETPAGPRRQLYPLRPAVVEEGIDCGANGAAAGTRPPLVASATTAHGT